MNDTPMTMKKEKPKTTLHISFAQPDEIYDAIGQDFEIEEEMTLTITGKVTGFSINRGDEKNTYMNSASFDMEIMSINGKTGKQKTNEKELKSTISDEEGEDEDEETKE